MSTRRHHVYKFTLRAFKFAGLVTLISAVISAVSYLVPRAAPVYEGGQLVHTTRFLAHDNGFPLTFVHNTCYGSPLVCHAYFDWWAFASNTLFLAAAITLGWFAFKWYTRRRKHK